MPSFLSSYQANYWMISQNLLYQSEGGMEEATLESETLPKRHVEGRIDGLLAHPDYGKGVVGNLFSCLQTLLHQVVHGKDLANQAPIQSLLGINMVTYCIRYMNHSLIYL